MKQTELSRMLKTLVTAASAAVTWGTSIYAAPMPKLPVISQVGVIPPQWEERQVDLNLEHARGVVAQAFPEVVRASKRFRVLNDDLVRSLWHEASGRQELSQQFELHAFVGLGIGARGDTVTFTGRLLDHNLKTLLSESDVVPRSWLAGAGAAAITDHLEKLVFRLFNRIPVDVAVTSVQGIYVTLSGGSEQGIHPGDTVSLERTSIKSLHPANGSWLDFESRPLGQAQIIEVKTYSSIAKLLRLTYEDAVEVGDGARIPAIKGRSKFARLASADQFKASGDPATIIVPPLYTSAPEGPQATQQNSTNQPDVDSDANIKQDGAQRPPAALSQSKREDGPVAVAAPAAAAASSDEGDATEDAGDSGPSIWDQMTDGLQEVTERPFDTMTAYVGPQWWSVSSKEFSDASKFPLWLVNSAGLSVTRNLFHNIMLGFGGGIQFGSSKHGSYFGYESHAELYWDDHIQLGSELLNRWRAGTLATFSGISVAKGKYGGGDWIRGGAFGGLGGTIRIGDDSQRYDWFGDFALMPLNIGRVGYSGSRKAVESSLGWRLSLGAFKYEPVGQIQFGGAVETAHEAATLANGRRPTFKDYALKALAKWSF